MQNPGGVALESVFRARAVEGRAALVAYITAGFPDPTITPPALDALADGPTIQAASFRALEAGMSVAGCLALLSDFRARRDTPVVLFSYLNPILHYGPEKFARDAVVAGAQGVLLTDLPAGADPELEEVFRAAGLGVVRLLAPTTQPHRLPQVAEGSDGFLYYISRTGVTGARTSLREDLAQEVERIREAVALPVAVGFGVSTADQAGQVARMADGVVVGSALVKALELGGVDGMATLARDLRDGMDRATASLRPD